MALIDVLNELNDRSTFGTTVVINDGNLRIAEGLAPDRICIIGACSNSASNAQGTDYLIPTNSPFRITTLRDLRYFRNDDPDTMPSEILMQFEDAYNAGGRSFEFVITTRTVGQLGGDVTAAGTILPVSTIYTNKVTAVGTMGAHPTGNIGCAVFTHNEDIFFVGGERPDTPATATLDSTNAAGYATGDYFYFEHTDGTIFAFWFDLTGADTVPAAVTALENAGAAVAEITITGLTDEQAADAICAAIETSEAPFSAYDGGAAGVIDLECDEPGVEGNLWTIVEQTSGLGITANVAGGAATNTISRKIVKFDPATDTWSNLTNTSGVPIRMVVARRDAGVVRHSSTKVYIPGGMTSLRSNVVTEQAVTDVDSITFSGAGASTATIAAGTALGTRHGEGTWVQIANGTAVVFGGNVANGAVASRLDTVFTVTTTAGPDAAPMVDSTINMTAATRWAGGFYNAEQDLIFVAGGETSGGAIAETVVWDVAAVDFTTAITPGNLSEAKYDFACVAVADAGWALGGRLDASTETKVIERFDPDAYTWQRKSDLGTAADGGRASVSNYHIFYADDVQGSDYNIGLGNLSDQYVGFPNATPFYIQVDWEIMQVTGTTVTRARSRDVDAFVVVRAQKGSTAVAHVDFADVVEEPDTLYSDLDTTYADMMNTSRADYLLLPTRVVADCPYLIASKNFAWQAASYCHMKTAFDRGVMAVMGVFPPNEDPTAYPTIAEESTWITTLLDFDRTNHLSQEIWKIGDGVTDANNDRKPDTYAFWFTSDLTIPGGTPPMTAGNVVLDEDNQPIDIGKYLFIVYPYGFSSGPNYVRKYPSASFGVLRSAAASYAGSLTTLESSEGSTNMAVRGFVPYKLFSMVQENRLNGKRYLGVVDLGTTGLRWNTGYTFAWNVSEFARSDYVLGSTFRKTVHVTRIMRSILARYFGKPTNGQHLNALQVELANAIKELVDIGVVGPQTDFEFRVSRADKILGRGVLVVDCDFEGELTHVQLVVSQKVS